MNDSSHTLTTKQELEDTYHGFTGKMKSPRTAKLRSAPYIRSKSVRNEVPAQQLAMGDDQYEANNVPFDQVAELLKSKDREIKLLEREIQLTSEVTQLKAELAKALASKECVQCNLAEANMQVQRIQREYEGYRAILNDKVYPTIICAVCQEPMHIQATLHCEHSFCGACVVQWFSQPDTVVTCPLCRQFIATRPLLLPAYRDTLVALTGREVHLQELTMVANQLREMFP